MFDLLPGASRQSEATSLQHKVNITEISVCRAGSQDDQYIVFIDEHRDLFCATIKRIQNQTDEIYKIGTLLLRSVSKLLPKLIYTIFELIRSSKIQITILRHPSKIVYVGK